MHLRHQVLPDSIEACLQSAGQSGYIARMHSVAHLIQVLVHDPPVPPKCVNLLQQPPLDVRIPCDAVNAEAEGVGGGLIAREDEGIALSHDLQAGKRWEGRRKGRQPLFTASARALGHRDGAGRPAAAC